MSRNGGTLLEVARHCAVSQSTVSRVLNNTRSGRFSVSPEVRQKILAAAEALNYRPSVAARNLSVTRTRLVAVLGVDGIWGGSDRVGPGEVAVGALAGVLDRAGYEITVQFYSSRHGPYEPPPLRVDGIVTVSASVPEDLVALERSGIPYVSINGIAGPCGSQVSPDDARGTRLALQHLYDLGHRRVAYLDNPYGGARHPSVVERRSAFARVAAELGIEVPSGGPPPLPANVAWDNYYEPFARHALALSKATAVLAYSHHGALGLMRTAHDLGMKVPDDFSLVCFNNEPVVQLTIPSLTAIDVPAIRMGEAAAGVLLRLMDPGAEPKPAPMQVRLDETLIVRESTAPPGGRRGGNGA